MNPFDFLKTLYLGDRACKAVLIYSWDKLIKVQIDEISRVRSLTGDWNFYNDENIKDGYPVFENVRSINFKPENFIPNDFIHDIEIHKLEERDCYLYVLLVGSIDQNSITTEVEISIVAGNLKLEDKAGNNIP